ncbi:MAG: FN3 associated domain-containing protein, partial [bacterium]
MMNKQINLIVIATISFVLLYIYALNNFFRFSMPSGFYEDDFLLKIIAPTNEVYYTLDGSIPTKNSIRYTKPILITDASLNENSYSMREDTSTFLLEDLIIQYNNDETYTSIYNLPDYLIDKCTVVRAMYYDAFGVAQEVNTATYFVGYQNKTGYDTNYTISIITEPDNLFADD